MRKIEYITVLLAMLAISLMVCMGVNVLYRVNIAIIVVILKVIVSAILCLILVYFYERKPKLKKKKKSTKDSIIE